ncbi:pirin family protein [Burkholderia cenocepacia]|uniref:pirin family protein n=1 Tax=Burkholderia cenocepacia TaxID=95486 RepID=UPI0009B56CC7|nr:pirin family protein [Burkholderia cenocepacia]
MEEKFEIVDLKNMVRGNHFNARILRGDFKGRPIDPFLGVDHAWVNAPTFPPHPHAGFSAVSYVLEDSETGILNRDSLGTRNLILPGGLHWTAAGRGVVHEEVPIEAGKITHMLQIFVNLSPHKQQADPFTLSLEPERVPIVLMPGVRIRVPLGTLFDRVSPLAPPTDVGLFDISLDGGAKVELPIRENTAAFVIPISGRLTVGGQSFDAIASGIPVFEPTNSHRTITLVANEGLAQAVIFSGEPLRQPVYWQGSMAMASPLALSKAVAEFSAGRFGTIN